MLEEQSIKDFSVALMSKSPVPGGGGVSALAGALAACLGGMATNLTIGKRKFIPVEPMLKEKLQMLMQYRDALLRCMQEDAGAFEPLSRACGNIGRKTEKTRGAGALPVAGCTATYEDLGAGRCGGRDARGSEGKHQ